MPPNSASNWRISSSYFGSMLMRPGNCEVLDEDVEVRGVVVLVLLEARLPAPSDLAWSTGATGGGRAPMRAGVFSDKAETMEEGLEMVT